MKNKTFILKYFLLLSIVFCDNYWVVAQNIVLPINHEQINLYEAEIHRIDSFNFHTAVKPFASGAMRGLLEEQQEKLNIDNNFTKRKIGALLLNDNLFEVQTKDYNITINALLSNENGINTDTTFGSFVRGAQISGSIKDKFFFSSEVFAASFISPPYVVERNKDTETVLGNGARRVWQGSARPQETTLSATSQLTYQPNKYFQFQLGHGKNFIGDGYRSLLLSDNSTFYPYFKVTTNIWKLQYTNLYTSMIDVQSGLTSQDIYPRKYITSHYLSWNVTPRLNIGLFETVIYEDSSNTRGYDLHYLNPILFYRPIEYEIGSTGGNALLGLNVKFKATNNLHLYGQFILDEFSLERNRIGDGCWCNKYGIQAGFKSFNTFIPNLTVQSEVNMVTFYTYSHRTPLQNYANSNLALAHPLGANFIESMTILRYRKDRWLGKVQFMYAVQGVDSLGTHWGADINRPFEDHEQDYGNTLLQGVRTNITYADISIGYLLNPRSNSILEFGYRHRGFTPEVEVGNLTQNTTSFIYIGLKTNFLNWYYDY